MLYGPIFDMDLHLCTTDSYGVLKAFIGGLSYALTESIRVRVHKSMVLERFQRTLCLNGLLAVAVGDLGKLTKPAMLHRSLSKAVHSLVGHLHLRKYLYARLSPQASYRSGVLWVIMGFIRVLCVVDHLAQKGEGPFRRGSIFKRRRPAMKNIENRIHMMGVVMQQLEQVSPTLGQIGFLIYLMDRLLSSLGLQTSGSIPVCTLEKSNMVIEDYKQGSEWSNFFL